MLGEIGVIAMLYKQLTTKIVTLLATNNDIGTMELLNQISISGHIYDI